MRRVVWILALLAASCDSDSGSSGPRLDAWGPCPTTIPSGQCAANQVGLACYYPTDAGQLTCDCSTANGQWSCWPTGSGIDSAL